LSPAELQHYHDLAATQAAVRSEAQRSDIAFEQTALALADQRRAQETAEQGVTHRSMDVRFGPSDFDRLRNMLESPTFTRKEVTKLRAKALESPERPTEAVLDMLEEAEPEVYKTQAKVQPASLIKTLAAAREELRGAVFASTLGHGDAAYLFLFAQVTPVSLHFLVLEKDDCVLPADPLSGHNAAGQHADPTQAWFQCRWKSTDKTITDAALDIQEDWVVVQHSFCTHGAHIVSDSAAVHLGALAAGLPKQAKAQATEEQKERKQAKRQVDAEMVESHPWLEDYLGKPKKRRGAPPASASGAADSAAHEAEGATAEPSDPVEMDLAAVYAEVLARGQFSWQQMWNGQSSPNDKNGCCTSPLVRQENCAAQLRSLCTATSPAQTRYYHYAFAPGGCRTDPSNLTSALQDITAFQLTRGPYALLGHGWLGCSRDYVVPPEINADYGEPTGLCTETAPSSGVFTSDWTKATFQLDCNTWTPTITLK
jgi:hypothetical protein